jgi:hypothetical protein
MAGGFQPRFVDLVRNYSTTTGTDDFILGPAVNGFADFAAACQVGDSFYYSATGVDTPAETEVGRGTLLAGGVISRDPISGTKTNFSTGTKSIALIAAADWFTSVDAASGVPSRDMLAALAERDRAALLTEPGREGQFVFDPSDLSAEVANDPNQGVYVPPAADPTGASGAWVRKFDGALNVKWFGAIGDGVTDCYAAIQGALDLCANSGGSIYIPGTTERYRVSQRLLMTAAVHLYGDAQVQDARVASHPDADIGSTLYFDAGVGGLLIEFINANDRNGPATYAGGTTACIERLKFMSAGGGATPAGLYGIEIRASITMRNVEVTFFGDHCIYVNASLVSTANAFGDANGTYFEKCEGNGSIVGDGFRISGTDSNVCTLVNCSAAGNAGYALTDDTLIGLTNIGFIFQNGNGACNQLIDSAPSTHIACEWEGGTSSLGSSTTVIGGNYAQQAPHVAAPSAFVMSAGLAFGSGYRHVNAGGTTTIGCSTGKFGIDMAAYTFGISAALGYQDYKIRYNIRGDNRWSLCYGDSNNQLPMQWPDGVNTSGRGFAMEFMRGICIGSGDLGGVPAALTLMGTAAPTTGTWQRGDLVINKNPAAGGVFAWRCTTAGAPGSWEAIYAGLSGSPTIGIGYTSGAGGTVAQTTSKSNGVTLNKICGEITMNAAALAAGTAVSFVLTNSAIGANDNIILNHVATGSFGAYSINARCAAGSATIDVRNVSAAALSEAIVLRFTVIKSVVA